MGGLKSPTLHENELFPTVYTTDSKMRTRLPSRSNDNATAAVRSFSHSPANAQGCWSPANRVASRQRHLQPRSRKPHAALRAALVLALGVPPRRSLRFRCAPALRATAG